LLACRHGGKLQATMAAAISDCANRGLRLIQRSCAGYQRLFHVAEIPQYMAAARPYQSDNIDNIVSLGQCLRLQNRVAAYLETICF
jgi:hypothetical protein